MPRRAVDEDEEDDDSSPRGRRKAVDEDEEEEDSDPSFGSSDDDEESDSIEDYDYLVGSQIYVGRNDDSELVLYKSPGGDVHARLSNRDLERAKHFVGVGERLKEVDGEVWLKLKFAKPVWLSLADNDVEAD
ncbi:MAG: hypothetical protein EAZ97_09370 [Bacteroidetes bacterium]|nr:MAG: hypothetical protein EAZ97_09370 [Bacteroidota bacterium]